MTYDAINGKPQQFPVTAEESPYFGVSLGGFKMNPPEIKVDSNYEEKLNCINATMNTHVVESSISLAPAFYKKSERAHAAPCIIE